MHAIISKTKHLRQRYNITLLCRNNFRLLPQIYKIPESYDCKNKQRVKYSFFEITVLLRKCFYYATLAVIYAHIISIEVYVKQQRIELLVIIVTGAVHTR